MPILPINPHDLPDEIACLKSIKDAREEAASITAQLSSVTAISTSVRHEADSEIWIGDEVLFFKEKRKTKWTAFVAANVKGNILSLDSGD